MLIELLKNYSLSYKGVSTIRYSTDFYYTFIWSGVKNPKLSKKWTGL
jgi:hypothetical protein